MTPEITLPARYAPDIPFPPYAYVPGVQNHPTQHPLGHSYNAEKPKVDAPNPQNWRTNPFYLYGIDLFNYGYYWEAHEAWEELWHACGHVGETADFLKALIKLTAAGVKVREERPEGVVIHATNGKRLFGQLQQSTQQKRYMGLRLGELIAFSGQLAENPLVDGRDIDYPRPVFAFSLEPAPFPLSAHRY